MVDQKRFGGCLWPMWPNGERPNHEYCGDSRAPCSSYCEEHRVKSIRNFDEEPRRVFVPGKIAA